MAALDSFSLLCCATGSELPEGDWFCPGCDAMMSAGMGADLAIR